MFTCTISEKTKQMTAFTNVDEGLYHFSSFEKITSV
jgi:hypothetical protein